jgi:hypothetical protein
MTSQEIEAVAGGGDSFHVLGPHSVSGKEWEVRAFLPQAESAAVVLNGSPFAMKKLHADGCDERGRFPPIDRLHVDCGRGERESFRLPGESEFDSLPRGGDIREDRFLGAS